MRSATRTLAERTVTGGAGPAAVSTEPAALIRYGQVWEDADVLLAGLEVQPGDVCVSIASAGDNTLALLTKNPSRVIAIDVNPAQLACLELRVAAYRALTHAQLLQLLGSRSSMQRHALYSRCRPYLSAGARRFWDARPRAIAHGIGRCGRFEHYLRLFRRRVLPLVHSSGTITRLLQRRTLEERRRFYDEQWDTWQWRALFRAFFSRCAMGALGRDPEYFRHVETDIASSLLNRTRYALTELDPSSNPYVHWILTGRHAEALPYALRPEHFETIRGRLDRLEWRVTSLEGFLERSRHRQFDRFNLSDVFEYVSAADYEWLLRSVVRCSRPGARLAYWNLVVRRQRPQQLAGQLRPLAERADALHRLDRAFFYSAFRLEEAA